MYGIDLDKSLEYEVASMREFAPHEKHVKRKCESDVLVMVLSGVLRFNEDGVDYEIMPGEYYIQHFEAIHGDSLESDCPRYLYIHFRGTWNDSRTCLPKRGTFIIEEIIGCMTELNRLVYGGGCKTEILSCFYNIMTYLLNGRNHTESQAERILKLLTSDIKDPPSLEELSAMCHFSRNHIINLVKKEFGMTPYEYLKRERIRLASSLLSATDISLEETAESCGFGDYTSFFRAFKSVRGVSPSEWRGKCRQRSDI